MNCALPWPTVSCSKVFGFGHRHKYNVFCLCRVLRGDSGLTKFFRVIGENGKSCIKVDTGLLWTQLI